MKRIMIDIETLSLDPRALILSIGAVDFTGDKLVSEFYVGVNAYEQDGNRHVSADTALWWIKQAMQNPDAATALLGGKHILLPAALHELAAFCTPAGGDDQEVWFNGPQFDAVVLRSAYDASSIKCPWLYNQERDCRTIFKIAESKGWDSMSVDYTSFTAHNALADAKIQALRLISALKYLGIN
jgi:hypothetical protein